MDWLEITMYHRHEPEGQECLRRQLAQSEARVKELEDELRIGNGLCARLTDRVNDLEAIVEKLHPRVRKLMAKGRAFIVIGEHEPYFVAAYTMIRNRELETGTWSDIDEECYREAAIAAKGTGK